MAANAVVQRLQSVIPMTSMPLSGGNHDKPDVCDKTEEIGICSFPLTANSGQYRAIGASISTNLRSASICKHVAVSALVPDIRMRSSLSCRVDS